MKILDSIFSEGIIAIVRTRSEAPLTEALRAMARGGVHHIEITSNTSGFLKRLEETAALCPEICLGAGTILSAQMARDAVSAGAKYLVTPIMNREIIDASKVLGAPVIMGAFTPTEIYQAHLWGADAVKLFPAAEVGPSYLKAVLAPLPPIALVPTGGITVKNAPDWMRAGAKALGIGTALFDEKLLEKRDYAAFTERAAALRTALII